MFVSGEFGDGSRRDRDGSFATGRDRSFASRGRVPTFDEELSHMQATLEEKDREIASMRADRARLERSWRMLPRTRIVARRNDARNATPPRAPRRTLPRMRTPPRSTRTSRRPPPRTREVRGWRRSRRRRGAPSARWKAARALPDPERAPLEATPSRRETLVEKASAVVRESAAAERSEETARAEAEAEAELAALKAAVAAARRQTTGRMWRRRARSRTRRRSDRGREGGRDAREVPLFMI